MIFETSNSSQGWYGTYNGQLVQDGVYIWKISFKHLENGKKEIFSGHISVLK
jgi:hypothetical protein